MKNIFIFLWPFIRFFSYYKTIYKEIKTFMLYGETYNH